MKKIQKHLHIILIIIISVIAVSISLAVLSSALMKAKTNLHSSNVSVRFLGEAGEVLLEKKVPQGAFAIPPSDIPITRNQVMQGWYGSMLNVSSDSDCRISLKDISNETNAFYINTQYVPCNGSFEMDVCVGGKVNLSSIEFFLPYDDRSLQYESSESSIGSVENEKPGVLSFLLNDQPVTEDVILFSVRFKAIGKPFSFVELKPSISKAITLLANGTEITEYQVIPAQIYLYDEEASK